MSVYNEIKKAFSSALDIIVDKTTTQAQKSRLVTVMKNEERIANQIYIELGKYLYSKLRSEMPEEVEELCTKLDESRDRMSRAQQIYRDVIRQEYVNREINITEAKENFQKIKEPIVTKVKDAAVKVKDSAKDTATKVGELKEAAAEKAEDLKNRAYNAPVVENDSASEEEKTAKDKVKECIIDANLQTSEENIVDEVLTVGQGLSDNVEVIENAIFSDSSLGEDSVSDAEEESREIFSFTGKTDENSAEAEENEKSFVPEINTIDPNTPRNIPIDFISENEFEKDEPEIKQAEKDNPITKSKKLKYIITKKNSDTE